MTAPAEIPSVLLPYQAEAITLADSHDLFVSEKSRRTGMSYGFAARAVIKAAPAIGAVNTFYIGYNKDMAREFIAYCGDFAKMFDQAASASDEFLFDDGSEKGILALRVDFPSGKSVVALSSRPRSLRGMQGDVVIDEAAFHDDLEAVITAALALVMWGGRVAVISTHNGADNYFNQLVEDIRGGKRAGEVHRLTLSNALAQGLYRRICLRTGKTWSPEAEREWEAKLRATYGDGAGEELDVVPSRGSGVYFPRAMVEACTAADYRVVRLTCPAGFEGRDLDDQLAFVDDWLAAWAAPAIADLFDPTRRSFFGQDFARSSDLSVVACGQEDHALTLRNPLVVEMRNVPFRSQKRVLDYLVRQLPNWATGKMDARGNGQQLAEDMRQDWGMERIEAVMATQAIYLARMPRVKTRLEDRTVVIPRDDGLLDDLRLVKLANGIPTIVDRVSDNEDGAKGKRHGDFAIALMNLVAAAEEDIQLIELAVTNRPRAEVGAFVRTTTGFGTIARRDDFGGRGAW
jgi:phage FluMu gp28-like protein